MNQDRNILMNSKQIEGEHMNKIIKSICALFVSLFMVLGMGVTAFAEDTPIPSPSITQQQDILTRHTRYLPAISLTVFFPTLPGEQALIRPA